MTLTPNLLGAAGLIPFIVGAAVVLFFPGVEAAPTALHFYAVAILSFLGGVHWGDALNPDPDRPARLNRFVFSVAPSLIAWATFALPAKTALLCLAVAFVAFWAAERRFTPLPAWFRRLRLALTVVVAACLAAASIAL